jgi:tetratricopeptide (TPR) repeat protein
MADCYRRINHTQRAIAAYKNAIRFKQKDSLTLFHLGRLQLKNGSYKDAENTFLEMIEEGNRSQLVKNGLQSARMAPQWKAEAEYSGYTV